MNDREVLFLAAAIFFAAVSVIVIIINRKRTRTVLNRLEDMLDAAVNGSFTETVFDESLLSLVETKMAHFLSASEVSAQNLEAEKNKIKELIADISHQTKTPIANILLYGQLLLEQNLPKESASCAAALHAQAEKLSFLIQALIKTSRLEAGMFQFRLKTTEVASMLAPVLLQIKQNADEKNISLEWIPTKITACFDRRWTGEAIYNIVDNAVKYTDQGGSIKIEAFSYQLFCCIEIKDTGFGIKEEEQAKIFKRFYRAESVSDAEGVGIGLYLARQIISGQGGYIKVKSAPGAGTTFSVYLPF